MKSNHFKLCLAILLCSSCIISHAQESDPLQAYIDQLAQRHVTRTLIAPRSEATIDLSEYPEPRTETLHIHGYIEITFVNGTLRRDSTFLEAPLIMIEEDAALIIAENAAVATCTNRVAKSPLIEINEGELIIDGGTILGKTIQTNNNNVASNDEQNTENEDGRRNTKTITTLGMSFIWNDPAAVELSSAISCRFCLLSGRVDSDVKNVLMDDQYGNTNIIQINGGCLNGELQSMNDIRLEGEAFVNCIDLQHSKSLVKIWSSLTHTQTIKGVTPNVPAVMIASDDITVNPNMIWFIDDYRPESVMQTNENGKTMPYIIPREWGPVRTFSNNTAGQLAYISAANREITTEVIVSGELNGSDIKVLRQMGAKALKSLNMSQARIISGGESYYSTTVSNGSIRPTTKLYYTENDTISFNMFANCIALEEVWLPQGVRVIEGIAFSGCTSLHSLHGLTDVYELSSTSFSNCEALVNFDLSDNSHLTMTNGIIYTADFTSLLAALPSLIDDPIEIPSTVCKSNSMVFANCQKITHIDWPKTLTEVPYGMFSGCKNLTEFKFPTTLTTIESLAFSDCNLSNIHLPATLTEIGSGAFANNPLSIISCEATTPPHITEYYDEEWGTINIPLSTNRSPAPRTFAGVDIEEVTLHLHKGCTKAYQDSQNRTAWLVFSNMIEDLSSDPLQTLIDELSEAGTSENPVELPLPDSGIVVVEDGDVDISGSLQLLISGASWAAFASPETNSPQPVIHMPGGNINVAPEASLTLQNVSLTASASDCHLKIKGKLVIDDNVKATQFKKLIVLEEGSQLIWKSGMAEATESVIQNDGGNAIFHEADIHGQINNNGHIVVKTGNYDGGETSALNNAKGNVVIQGGKWTGGKGVNNANSHNDSEEAQAENAHDHIIANHGHISIEAGTFGTNGEGSIWTDSDIDINGKAELGSIYIQQGNQINLTGQMTNSYTIHIQHDEGEEIGTGVVVTGANGYKITQEDATQIAIELPDRYYSKYDEQNNTISICKSQNDNIRVVNNSKNLWTEYDLIGRKRSHKSTGIFVSKGTKVVRR